MKKTLLLTLVLLFLACASLFALPETITLHLKALVPVRTKIYDNLFELEYDEDTFGVEVIRGAKRQGNGTYLRETKDVVISLNVII